MYSINNDWCKTCTIIDSKQKAHHKSSCMGTQEKYSCIFVSNSMEYIVAAIVSKTSALKKAYHTIQKNISIATDRELKKTWSKPDEFYSVAVII